MKIGIVLSDASSAADEAALSERLGFDYVAAGEHVFFPTDTHNAFVVLAAAAAATSRVRLLSSVTLLALYPPPLAAKLAATLAHVSSNRFDLGVGAGGDFRPEFTACGVFASQRGKLTDRGLATVVSLLRGGSMVVDGVGLELKPPAPGHIPIWIAGRREAAWRRAARFADWWLPYMYTPEMLAFSLARIRGLTREFGRTPETVRGAIFLHAYIDADSHVARQAAIDYVTAAYAGRVGPRVERYLLAGSPEDVASRLSQYRSAGAEIAIIAFPASPERHRMLALLAERVLPAIERAAPIGKHRD